MSKNKYAKYNNAGVSHSPISHQNHPYQMATNHEEFLQKLEECLPGGLPKEIRDGIIAIK